MFALVLFICYLDGGCEDIVVDVYREETQCLVAMEDQRIRHGGCYPIEDFIDGFGNPPANTATFSLPTAAPPASASHQTQRPYQYSVDYRGHNAPEAAYGQTRNGPRRQ